MPEDTEQPTVIIPPKPLITKPRIIIGLVFLIVVIIFGVLGFRSLFSPQAILVSKQAKMLQITQGLDQKKAKTQAQELIASNNKIRQEAAKRGITVTSTEIDKEAQKIIKQTSQTAVTAALQSYGWNELDWKEKIAIDILKDKLQKNLTKWRDYQYLAIRWDNHSKEQLPSEDKAWEQAKPILEKARLMLDQKQDIATVAAQLSKDPKITRYFVIQPLTQIQRIYSDTKIASDLLKQAIFSTPPNSLSQPIRLFGFGVVIKTFEGSGQVNKSTFNFSFPSFHSIIKTAYASHLDIASCTANGGQQYCADGDYCYYEGVIAGYVRDPAGNPVAEATVRASDPGPTALGCLCTGISGSVISGGDGGYDIHGLCCFNTNFSVTASKSGYSCNSYPVSPSNGTSVSQNITCTPLPPSCPASGAGTATVCGQVTYDNCTDSNGLTGSSICSSGAVNFTCQSSINSACVGNSYNCSICRPSNLSLNTPSCPAPGTSAHLSWTGSSAPVDRGTIQYNLRINDYNDTNTTAHACISNTPAGDACWNNAALDNNYPTITGHNYGWWVDACNSAGCTTNPGTDFTCTSSIATPITITSCTALDSNNNPITSASVGQSVTWKVVIDGGIPNFNYTWTGTDGLSSTTSSSSSRTNSVPPKTYTTAGSKTADISVTDSSSPTQTKSASCSITITAPFDFSLSDLNPKTITQGSADTQPETVTKLQGAEQQVNLTISGCPSGVTCTIAPTFCTPTDIAPCSHTINMTTSSTATTATTGTSTVTVTGVSGTRIHSKTFALTITAPALGTPPAPAITTPSCIDPGYTGSGVNISWTNSGVTWVDVSHTNDSSFTSPYYHRSVSGVNSTTGPSGFNATDGSGGLTLNPATNYYVRTYNGTQNSQFAGLNVPACAPSCTAETDADLCKRLGKDCDRMIAPDNCGDNRTVNCGACSGSQTCNAHVCTNRVPSTGCPWIQTTGGDVHSNTRINITCRP